MDFLINIIQNPGLIKAAKKRMTSKEEKQELQFSFRIIIEDTKRYLLVFMAQ